MNIIKIIALSIVLLLTGCSDSDLEKENANLQLELKDANRYNTQLQTKLNRLNGLEKELNNIRKNNKDLAITLAKSELLFSKKYKKELKKEEERLKDERTGIESNAHLLAEKNAKNKYMIIIASLVVFFLAFIGFTFFKRNEYLKKILEMKVLNTSINKLNQRLEEQKEYIISLELSVKEMEIRAKEASINQVVRKIDENELHRNQSLKRIEKEFTDA